MTVHDLIERLEACEGPCLRFCAYCPEDLQVAETKECLEDMYREMYELQMQNKLLERELAAVKKKFKEVTGHEYTNT